MISIAWWTRNTSGWDSLSKCWVTWNGWKTSRTGLPNTFFDYRPPDKVITTGCDFYSSWRTEQTSFDLARHEETIVLNSHTRQELGPARASKGGWQKLPTANPPASHSPLPHAPSFLPRPARFRAHYPGHRAAQKHNTAWESACANVILRCRFPDEAKLMARAKRKAQPSADGDTAPPEGDDDSRFDWSVLVPILKQHLSGPEPRVALESCSQHLHLCRGAAVLAAEPTVHA